MDYSKSDLKYLVVIDGVIMAAFKYKSDAETFMDALTEDDDYTITIMERQ